MIRFEPDSWFEAVARPLAMGLPQSWIYTEIMAPDMRFAFLVVLMGIFLGLRIKGAQDLTLGVNLRVALGVVVMSFPVWMWTGGNGRYFMPVILMVGPLLVAFWRTMPLRPLFKWLMMGVFVLLQGMAVATNPPWLPFDTLEWVRWRGPDYFRVDVRALAQVHGVTYVTLPGQSNSMVAPMFPQDSHWINLTSFEGQDLAQSERPVVAEARRRLKAASDARLIVRSQPREAVKGSGVPTGRARQVLDLHLKNFGLRLSTRIDCVLLPSATFGAMTPLTSSDKPSMITELKARAGFWVCPIEWLEVLPHSDAKQSIPPRVDQAMKKIESLCPRLFPPGQAGYLRRSYGYDRGYSESDSNLSYVVSEDMIYVKMFRALNPQPIGLVEDILSPGFILNCAGFVGREGVPWKRNI